MAPRGPAASVAIVNVWPFQAGLGFPLGSALRESLSTRAFACIRQPSSARVDSQIAAAATALKSGKSSWPRLAAIRVSLDGCDDGYVSEGISDVSCRSLADQWSSTPWSDQRLILFLIRHIDATCTQDDLQAIVGNAQQCPKNRTRLCTSLVRAAKQAMQ